VEEEEEEEKEGGWGVRLCGIIHSHGSYRMGVSHTTQPCTHTHGTQVLFFTRIYADILGRLAPRCRSLLLRSPTPLLVLVMVKVRPAPRA
jgi:hypothetical protein